MSKRESQINRIKNIIESENTIPIDFEKMLIADFKKLLLDYFDMVGKITFNHKLEQNLMIVNIDFSATGIKNFINNKTLDNI